MKGLVVILLLLIIGLLYYAYSSSNEINTGATATPSGLVEIPQYMRIINESLVSLYRTAEVLGYDKVTVELAERVGSLDTLPTCRNISGKLQYASDAYDKAREVLNVYRSFAEGVMQDYAVKLPYLTRDEINRLLNKAGEGDITALITMCILIDDYNGVVLAARNVEPGSHDTYTPFYNNLSKLIVDITLIKFDPSYKIAYKAVGNVFIKTGLGNLIREYGGNSALEAAMSLAHWEIRYKIRDIIEQYSENPEILFDKLNGLVEEFSP